MKNIEDEAVKRFLDSCYGKSESEIKKLYQENEQFRADYEIVYASYLEFEKELLRLIAPLIETVAQIASDIVKNEKVINFLKAQQGSIPASICGMGVRS
ncbi:hypothetical protein MX629_13880 [Carnobacterium divergens]|uniref:Uncharacterized protein n=1 Tax=Carnobacterium divergens TaxID=2748 RepID=A0AAW8RHB0_CARDV|nr:hypothetical protein [Carnobacterium divergens]MDT1943335.1 hypothetical protein [Carnobacterium divergens]MDT1959509.1 hypothetical protein [Carnobacterium divergens]MDT1975476.1 hypothetical protein [Carnobacterium divergens]